RGGGPHASGRPGWPEASRSEGSGRPGWPEASQRIVNRVKHPERLVQLVDAVLSIGSDLSLPDVLRRIVTAAVTLLDAKYGALGVLDESGHSLSEFVNVGLTEKQVELIGPLPEGHGILGLLIVDPKPLRLADLSAPPDS